MPLFLDDKAKKQFNDSENSENPEHVFVYFFDNASMARVLDMFAKNPDVSIFTQDFLQKADISEKALLKNMKILVNMGIVTENWIGRHKFYKWEKTNPSAKHIMKLYDIISHNAKNKKGTGA